MQTNSTICSATVVPWTCRPTVNQTRWREESTVDISVQQFNICQLAPPVWKDFFHTSNISARGKGIHYERTFHASSPGKNGQQTTLWIGLEQMQDQAVKITAWCSNWSLLIDDKFMVAHNGHQFWVKTLSKNAIMNTVRTHFPVKTLFWVKLKLKFVVLINKHSRKYS